MALDPTVTDPDHYTVVFENEHVRVLDYRDRPGDSTNEHEHPNSVMYALSDFRRRLHLGDLVREVEVRTGSTQWLPAQRHRGENIGDTDTHVVFVELKGPGAGAAGDPDAIGPTGG